jgi:threonine/homoserine/homoserine lactone efflux protein
MSGVVGSVLPLTVGIAISPIPIIAAILMLLSPRARTTSVGFLIGWLLGIASAATVFTLIGGLIPEQDPDRSRPILGVIQIVLGVLLLLVAARQWRGQPHADDTPSAPKWMRAIDRATFLVALGLGLLLSAANPKNLIMAASAGVDIGTAELPPPQSVGTIAVFTVLAASTVLVPVIGYLVAAQRLQKPLDRLREWLQRENAVIMALLTLVIGVVTIGKGISAV